MTIDKDNHSYTSYRLGLYTVVYHPGRQQPYTLWCQGYVVGFYFTKEQVDMAMKVKRI